MTRTHLYPNGRPASLTPAALHHQGKQVCHRNILSAAQRVGKALREWRVVNNRICNDVFSITSSLSSMPAASNDTDICR